MRDLNNAYQVCIVSFNVCRATMFIASRVFFTSTSFDSLKRPTSVWSTRSCPRLEIHNTQRRRASFEIPAACIAYASDQKFMHVVDAATLYPRLTALNFIAFPLSRLSTPAINTGKYLSNAIIEKLRSSFRGSFVQATTLFVLQIFVVNESIRLVH